MDEIWNLSYFRQYKPTVQISLNYKIWARQRFVDFGWIDPRVNLHLQVDSTIVRYIDANLLHKGIWKTFLYLNWFDKQPEHFLIISTIQNMLLNSIKKKKHDKRINGVGSWLGFVRLQLLLVSSAILTKVGGRVFKCRWLLVQSYTPEK